MLSRCTRCDKHKPARIGFYRWCGGCTAEKYRSLVTKYETWCDNYVRGRMCYYDDTRIVINSYYQWLSPKSVTYTIDACGKFRLKSVCGRCEAIASAKRKIIGYQKELQEYEDTLAEGLVYIQTLRSELDDKRQEYADVQSKWNTTRDSYEWFKNKHVNPIIELFDTKLLKDPTIRNTVIPAPNEDTPTTPGKWDESSYDPDLLIANIPALLAKHS